MRNVIIDQKGSQLSHDRQLLIISHDSLPRPIRLPFSQLQSLTIVTAVDISSTLLTKLAEQHITVNIIPAGTSGSPCQLHGQWHKAVTRRQIQYEVLRDETCCEQWALVLVKLRLYQQAKLLKRLLDYQHATPASDQAIQTACQKLHATQRKLKTYFLRPHCTLIAPRHDLARLRGIEGAGAATFFAGYQQFFAATLEFNHRNRRPPKDPVNALLSLGYTLLQGIYERAIFAIGLDPFIGVLHDVSYGRQSLACDFTELQRHQIEYFVWQLFANQTLTADDFGQTSTARPCELLKTGRSRFYQAFSALKPTLERHARRHVWLWLRRLERQCILTDAEGVLHASLDTLHDL